MQEKIYCDLLALYGPDWENLPQEKVLRFAELIHTFPNLLGTEPELYGFVGTRRITEDIVAGYFAIQYETEELFYKRNKKRNTEKRSPFARLFFILFARTGKILLQNSKFSGIPLTMHRASGFFKSAIDYFLITSEIAKTFNIALVPDDTSPANFVREFEKSTRVIKLEVKNPNGDQIPEDFVYYNPQKERNLIIRGSHQHDYRNYKKVELEAAEDGDIKRTHMRDLIYAGGQPQYMQYFVKVEDHVVERILRKSTLRKVHFYMDMDAEPVPEEQSLAVIEMLRKEQVVDIPTPLPSPKAQPGQQDLFAYYDPNEEADDEDEPGN
jgi:hypothetical protein